MNRKHEQTPQKRPTVCQNAEKRQRQPAQRQKISPSAQEKRRPLIEADLPVSPENGKQEQCGGRGEPEAQVQQRGGQPSLQPHPEHPEQVIQQPQPRAHRQRLQKIHSLGRHVHPHGQRSSRASREPPRSRRSSS